MTAESSRGLATGAAAGSAPSPTSPPGATA